MNEHIDSMSIREPLMAFREGLQELYGDRLVGLILYGSYARGDADDGSDIDVVVILSGDVVPCEEIDRISDLKTYILLEYNELIAVYPVSVDKFETVKSPLILNVKREGVEF